MAVVVSHPIQHFCPQYESWSNIEGIELKVFFASKHGLMPYKDKNFDRNVQWHNLKLNFQHEFLPGSESRGLNDRIDSPDLESSLSKYSPSLLVVYGYSQKLQRRAYSWAKDNEIFTLMIADSELRSRKSMVKTLIKGCILPGYFKKIDLFLTVGDANEAYYRRFGVPDEKMVRGFFPIDRKHYDLVLTDRERARTHLRKKLGIPNRHRVILNVGKLVPWKRQEDLVELSNRSQVGGSETTVILAGSGPDELRLKGLSHRVGPSGVIFAGFIDPQELVEFYCAADVYVHCSEHEPHSLAISEGLYCGLPIIVSDRCGSYGPTDDVQVGLNGYSYICGDIDDLEQKVNCVLNNGELMLEMGRHSSELAVRHQNLAHGGALKQAINYFEYAQ